MSTRRFFLPSALLPGVSDQFQPGDTIACHSSTCLGLTINLATWGLPFSGYSHVMGVIEYAGKLLIAESTSLVREPCHLRGERVAGLQCQRIGPRLRGYRGKLWLYRLAKPLDNVTSARLTKFVVDQVRVGRSYDEIGAFRARGAGFGWLERWFRRENLDSLFCSEFWAAALRHVSAFHTGNASKWNPNSLCRALRRRGVATARRRILVPTL